MSADEKGERFLFDKGEGARVLGSWADRGMVMTIMKNIVGLGAHVPATDEEKRPSNRPSPPRKTERIGNTQKIKATRVKGLMFSGGQSAC